MNRRSNPRNNRSCKLSAALQSRILSDLNLAPRRSRTHKAVAVALGIESKKEKLSKQEWKKILELAKERKLWDKPCVICCEHFKLDDQVLTSCCHAYHRACLFSFEKFVGGTKTCSLCRVKDYQKLNTSAGNPSALCRNACTIQSFYRAFKVRQEYQVLRDLHPPTDPSHRKDFFLRKLNKVTRSITDQVIEESSLEAFFADLDADLLQSAKVFHHCRKQMNPVRPPEFDWDAIRDRATERASTDCPICLQTLAHKPCVLLNCSHIFHHACMESFERFTTNVNVQCPLCRTEYTKIKL